MEGMNGGVAGEEGLGSEALASRALMNPRLGEGVGPEGRS